MQRDLRSNRIGRIAVLVAAVAAATIAATVGLRAEPSAKAGRHMSYYEVRRGLFALSKIKTAPIVMLGNSLTEAGPWTDLTGCLSIANRGIGGDTTAKLRDRLDDVVALQPRAIFLMIGVNDITLGIPGETTAGNLRAILDRLGGTDAHVFMSYVLPVTSSYGKKRINKEIPLLNAVIAKLAAGRPEGHADRRAAIAAWRRRLFARGIRLRWPASHTEGLCRPARRHCAIRRAILLAVKIPSMRLRPHNRDFRDRSHAVSCQQM